MYKIFFFNIYFLYNIVIYFIYLLDFKIQTSKMTISNTEMHNCVSRQLENSHFIISPRNEWFKQCVDFFMSNNPNVINIMTFITVD